eukprot:g16740.t1
MLNGRMANQEAKKDPKPHHCSGHVRGILATLLGALSLAIAALLVKVCAKSLSTLDILCGRAILQTCFVGVVFLTRCESPWGPRNLRGWLSLRGFLGCCAVVFYFMGIIALPLSEAWHSVQVVKLPQARRSKC